MADLLEGLDRETQRDTERDTESAPMPVAVFPAVHTPQREAPKETYREIQNGDGTAESVASESHPESHTESHTDTHTETSIETHTEEHQSKGLEAVAAVKDAPAADTRKRDRDTHGDREGAQRRVRRGFAVMESDSEEESDEDGDGEKEQREAEREAERATVPLVSSEKPAELVRRGSAPFLSPSAPGHTETERDRCKETVHTSKAELPKVVGSVSDSSLFVRLSVSISDSLFVCLTLSL